MAVRDWFVKLFGFHAFPVSLVTLLAYGAIFTAVLVTDQTPGVPKDLHGLDLEQAYLDLHKITERPRPVLSHANDDVHAYLVNRLAPIVDSRDYIELSDDLIANGSWYTSRGATYYEGTNILVKVEGTDASSVEPGGVLFSAHYDSVSTAPGATDDAMGIVTMLQLIEYFAKPARRPRRTAVFLFNNGEEDGLNGAHAFFEHPWSNLTTSFLNLEGAAAGGRPILFRSTSLSAARSFKSTLVRHPHGNVLSADAFARGVIRSGTDFEIYAKGIEGPLRAGKKSGLQGTDFAFYKNRAFYHTPLDSIPGMGRAEGRKALFAMMDSVRGAGLEMLNGDKAVEDGDTGVYFDVLGRFMITFGLRAMFIAQVLLLIVGPLSVFGPLAWVFYFAKKTEEQARAESAPSRSRYLKRAAALGWAKFAITLLVAVGLDVLVVVAYVKINPFVIHSRPYLVLAALAAVAFLGISLPVVALDLFRPSRPSPLKNAAVLELYGLTWFFQAVSAFAVDRLHIGGVYLFTVWNLCAWVAALIAVGETVVAAGGRSGHNAFDLVGDHDLPSDTEGHRFVRGIRYQAPEDTHAAEEEQPEGEEVETEPTEITPLMHQGRRRSTGGREYVEGIDGEWLPVNGAAQKDGEYEDYGWWFLQFVALVPVPALLLSQITLVLLHALNNGLVDGSSPVTVYAGLVALCTLIFLNLAPFAHRIYSAISIVVLAILVVLLVITWTVFPFATDAPLKVFFQQKVELTPPSGTAVREILNATTYLYAPSKYVDKLVVPSLPSSWGKPLDCKVDQDFRPGLLGCGWTSDLLPSPGGSASSAKNPTWFTFNAIRLNDTAASVSIRGTNTRACRLFFDTPVHSFHVHGSSGGMQPGYALPEEGIKMVLLWSREWENEFVVDFSWEGEGSEKNEMTGRAACEWAEYASGTAGSEHAGTSAQIPAYEEVVKFFPRWATSTKLTWGLVEASTPFSV